MNNEPERTDEYLNNNKTMQTMRVVWMVLVAVFSALVLWRLYNWSNGQDNLRGILSPLGMIFVGLGAIIRPRNRMLSYAFTGIALVLVISGLVLMFIY
jgi:polyferredoxin